MNIRIRDRVKKALNQSFEEKREAIPGILGDGAGNVVVAERAGFVWARTAEKLVQAFNTRVALIENLPVMLGYDHLNPGLFQVLDINLAAVGLGEKGEIVYNPLVSHRESHEYYGTDVVRVDLRAFLPLRVAPAGGLQVQVFRGIVPISSGGWTIVYDSYLDLSTYQPGTTGYSRYVLIYVDSLAQLGVLSGNILTSQDLALSDIPTPLPDTYSLAAVVLRNPQTEGIVENENYTDIVDLRFPQPWFSGPTTVGSETVYDLMNNVILTKLNETVIARI